MHFKAEHLKRVSRVTLLTEALLMDFRLINKQVYVKSDRFSFENIQDITDYKLRKLKLSTFMLKKVNYFI